MKWIFVLAALFTLNSCNTSIGIWRDTKAGYNWTKDKIQGTGGGGGYDSYSDPVY